MNREIKYQAWVKNAKEMVQVGAIQFPDSANTARLSFVVEWNGLRTWTLDEVDLREYIGLKDVAEKEIYEGDILGMENATAQVVYDLYEFVLDYSHNESEWCCDWDLSDYHRMEIIGNIYENPELLQFT